MPEGAWGPETRPNVEGAQKMTRRKLLFLGAAGLGILAAGVALEHCEEEQEQRWETQRKDLLKFYKATKFEDIQRELAVEQRFFMEHRKADNFHNAVDAMREYEELLTLQKNLEDIYRGVEENVGFFEKDNPYYPEAEEMKLRAKNLLDDVRVRNETLKALLPEQQGHTGSGRPE